VLVFMPNDEWSEERWSSPENDGVGRQTGFVIGSALTNSRHTRERALLKPKAMRESPLIWCGACALGLPARSDSVRPNLPFIGCAA